METKYQNLLGDAFESICNFLEKQKNNIKKIKIRTMENDGSRYYCQSVILRSPKVVVNRERRVMQFFEDEYFDEDSTIFTLRVDKITDLKYNKINEEAYEAIVTTKMNKFRYFVTLNNA